MKQIESLPTTQQLEAELARVQYHHRYNSVLRSTISILVVVAAVAVLVATLLLPVLQIYGSSMTPTVMSPMEMGLASVSCSVTSCICREAFCAPTS